MKYNKSPACFQTETWQFPPQSYIFRWLYTEKKPLGLTLSNYQNTLTSVVTTKHFL